MDKAELYNDIAQRTGGDVYIGVVGPVRTGKSTFIKRFMDLMVLPQMADSFARERAVDELPQSAAGSTIMTTQPKFVPNEAAELTLDGNTAVRVRLVDCVGYMIPGATGHMENEMPRMVRTPWADEEMPFEEAAEIGTRKVITEHSTLGVVVTTDGSITQLERKCYEAAEERVVAELKTQGKPFVIILNSSSPESERAASLAAALEGKYGCSVLPMDVMNMSVVEINRMLESILLEFPLQSVRICLPAWVCALDMQHWLVQRITQRLEEHAGSLCRMKDGGCLEGALADVEDFLPARISAILPGEGRVEVDLPPAENLFYRVLSEACGCEIEDDAHLISTIQELVHAKREYDRIASALDAAYHTGYGMVSPPLEEMRLEQPELMQQGGRFGVRLSAKASGLHLIRVDIQSEVSPLVGSQEQTEEFLATLLETYRNEPEMVWQTNIFGKRLFDLVSEGMSSKVNRLPVEAQQKLQHTVQRMVNDGCNGLICILL